MAGSARQTTTLTIAVFVAAMLLVIVPKASWGQERTAGPPGGARYVAGELIVTYEPGAAAETERAVGSRFEARTRETIPGIRARLLSFPGSAGSLARVKRALEQNPAVESVDYNYVLEPTFTPNDTRFGDQYGLQKIQSPKAWNIVRGNANVDIAIVDSGIDTDHPDLAAKIELQRDFTVTPEKPIAEDDDGHGTHVAGIAAAMTNNGAGVAGSCPGCDLFVAKVVRGGVATSYDAAEAIIWAADNGAEVVNVSLGARRGTDALKNAVDHAWNNGAGAVVVAAAGNRGRDVKDYPAAYANVIAVSATNKSDGLASYSSFGDWVDVAAPGSGVLSTKRGGGYTTMSGTSMAAPHVAGTAGLLAAQGRTAPGIRNRIESTARDLGPDGKDRKYGHGRINAYRAVGG